MQRPWAILVLLLSVASPRALGAVLLNSGLETSGEEMIEASDDELGWMALCELLVSDVTNLRDQQFTKDFKSDNMVLFKQHKITLPHMVEKDGCYPQTYNKEGCLTKMSSALMLYEVYQQFVKTGCPESSLVSSIASKTRSLIRYVTRKLGNVRPDPLDSTAQTKLLSDLPGESQWERKVTVHIILRQMRLFLVDACRGIRYITRRDLRKGAHRE